ncbi:hypothetical protein G6F68_018574 [Rhizopus microsporus]|nr:hypothetical protein G6F68_018574 [Rhizopus microsporus]
MQCVAVVGSSGIRCRLAKATMRGRIRRHRGNTQAMAAAGRKHAAIIRHSRRPSSARRSTRASHCAQPRASSGDSAGSCAAKHSSNGSSLRHSKAAASRAWSQAMLCATSAASRSSSDRIRPADTPMCPACSRARH